MPDAHLQRSVKHRERPGRRLSWILAVWFTFEVILSILFLCLGDYYALEWLLN